MKLHITESIHAPSGNRLVNRQLLLSVTGYDILASFIALFHTYIEWRKGGVQSYIIQTTVYQNQTYPIALIVAVYAPDTSQSS